MSGTVVDFPTDRFANNVKRHFEDLFARMRELGLAPDEQHELLITTLKACGLVEIDGVWQMPPDNSSSANNAKT